MASGTVKWFNAEEAASASALRTAAVEDVFVHFAASSSQAWRKGARREPEGRVRPRRRAPRARRRRTFTSPDLSRDQRPDRSCGAGPCRVSGPGSTSRILGLRASRSRRPCRTAQAEPDAGGGAVRARGVSARRAVHDACPGPHRSLNPARNATRGEEQVGLPDMPGTSTGTRPPLTKTKSASPKTAPITGRMAPARR